MFKFSEENWQSTKNKPVCKERIDGFETATHVSRAALLNSSANWMLNQVANTYRMCLELGGKWLCI